ncbi:hypothetical protein [Actinomadura roseirufa]|uniref:hypothetical protein n=1 Tax=Actinomadura roseirufa TaxID=2094049 RepID=UPI0010413996|nr:hypothetical protein [Actinomadura roseirufa]
MTEPDAHANFPDQAPQPYDPQEYEQLTQRMGQILVQIAPPDWRRIDLKILMVVDATDVALTVILKDGSSPELDPTRELVHIAARLRSIMYRENEGTWFGMRYMMDPPGAFWVSFNDRFDPHWDPPVPARLFAADVAVFPRAGEHVPAWLRTTLMQAGIPQN